MLFGQLKSSYIGQQETQELPDDPMRCWLPMRCSLQQDDQGAGIMNIFPSRAQHGLAVETVWCHQRGTTRVAIPGMVC